VERAASKQLGALLFLFTSPFPIELPLVASPNVILVVPSSVVIRGMEDVTAFLLSCHRCKSLAFQIYRGSDAVNR
jgi:hypothetical protein